MRGIIVMSLAIVLVAMLYAHTIEAQDGVPCKPGKCQKNGGRCVPPEGGQKGPSECKMRCTKSKSKPNSNRPHKPECQDNEECRAANEKGPTVCMPKKETENLAGSSSTVAGDSANVATNAPVNETTDNPTGAPTAMV